MHVIEEQEEQQDLGNARLALMMGNTSLVIAIVTPVLYFIGILISVASALFALMLYNRDSYHYKVYKERFTATSYSQLVKGRKRAIVSLVITAVWLIIWAVNYGKDGLN